MSETFAYILKTSAQQTLTAMSGFLRKAADHAKSVEVEDAVFLSARLYPDMFPMGRQVQIAADMAARGAARLAGIELPNFPDEETTLIQLADRAERANIFVQGAPEDPINANARETLQIPIGDQTMPMEGRAFLSNFILPNLHFHAATAYGLLRMQGVTLGKRDFLMPGS